MHTARTKFGVPRHRSRREVCGRSSSTGERVARVVLLIRTAERLAPFDRQLFNKAMAIWEEIETLQPEQRMELMRSLRDEDIEKLWKIAGERYKVDASVRNKVMGPDYSVHREFPLGLQEAQPLLSGGEDPSLVRYDGKAVGMPPGLKSFSKVFWMAPLTTELKGRVLLRRGAIMGALWPLYFRVHVAPAVVPGTGELADATLEYLDPHLLGVDIAGIPCPRSAGLSKKYVQIVASAACVTIVAACFAASSLMKVALLPWLPFLQTLWSRPWFLFYIVLATVMVTLLVAVLALPEKVPWPFPRRQLPPFEGLVDYLRHVGPGVFVGAGWKPPAKLPPSWWPWERWIPVGEQFRGMGVNGERKFLTFIMVRVGE